MAGRRMVYVKQKRAEGDKEREKRRAERK